MGQTFGNHGTISGAAFCYDTAPDGALKSKFSYYCIGSNYTDFDTDLEAEANINEEGNEDCSAIL